LTKTINQLRRDIEELEADARELLRMADNLGTAEALLGVGITLARVNVAHAMLELTVKGLLPETAYGRTLTAIGQALDATKERVCVGQTEEMPGS
jgi:hypothetical protein